MNRKRVLLGAIFIALLVAVGVGLIGFDQSVSAQGRGGGTAPRYTVQPLFHGRSSTIRG
jgi:hypothetical protein